MCLCFSLCLCKKFCAVHGQLMMNLSNIRYVNPSGFQLGTFREQRSEDTCMEFTFVIICGTHIFIFWKLLESSSLRRLSSCLSCEETFVV